MVKFMFCYLNKWSFSVLVFAKLITKNENKHFDRKLTQWNKAA
jgi:hypothetical protein